MKKKKTQPKWHKHIDKKGISFGALHPLNAFHKNKNTQNAHIHTVVSGGD